MKILVGRASVAAAFGGTGFQPVRRTGKMPVPPRTFQKSRSWAFGPPGKHEKWQAFYYATRYVPFINLEP
jgi:hypothetical protein